MYSAVATLWQPLTDTYETKTKPLSVDIRIRCALGYSRLSGRVAQQLPQTS